MNQMMDCAEARLSLGVYVLGAIDPAERSMVDSHLAVCRDCRDELAGLAGLPALLARVGTEEAIALAASEGPPPVWEEDVEPAHELVNSVLDLTAARRRRRTWREVGLGVAAALIIAVGVFGGLRMTAAPGSLASATEWPLGSDGQSGPWQTASGHSHSMGLTVKYRQMGWGTGLIAKVTGIPVGTTCQIWVVGPGKTRLLAGSWTVDDWEGSAGYPASAAIHAEQVQKFVVTVDGTNQSITADS
jgi:anti-sigma factor RsiW